jgi:hypothetical protein
MTTPPYPSYAGHRFPAEIISHAVWLYFRFPLSLRHVGPCCMDRRSRRNNPNPVWFQAIRTESGHPNASMRFSTSTAIATSVARRWSVRERRASPITRL